MSTTTSALERSVEVARRAGEGEPPLLLAAQQLGGEARHLARRVEERRPVRGVARRRRRGEPACTHARAVHAPRYSRSTSRVRSIGVVAQHAGRVDALAEPRDAHEPLERHARRRRRRAAASSSCRSRPRRRASRAEPVMRRRWRHELAELDDLVRPRARPTGSRRRTRKFARCAWRHLTPRRVPPTPPLGARRRRARRRSASRLRGVRVVGRRERGGVDRALEAPHAALGLEARDLADEVEVHEPAAWSASASRRPAQARSRSRPASRRAGARDAEPPPRARGRAGEVTAARSSGRASVPVGQRQNSSVPSTLETNPWPAAPCRPTSTAPSRGCRGPRGVGTTPTFGARRVHDRVRPGVPRVRRVLGPRRRRAGVSTWIRRWPGATSWYCSRESWRAGRWASAAAAACAARTAPSRVELREAARALAELARAG